MILAGQHINDTMGRHAARNEVRMMRNTGVNVPHGVMGVLGVTCREGYPYIRDSKVADLVGELDGWGGTDGGQRSPADAGAPQALLPCCTPRTDQICGPVQPAPWPPKRGVPCSTSPRVAQRALTAAPPIGSPWRGHSQPFSNSSQSPRLGYRSKPPFPDSSLSCRRLRPKAPPAWRHPPTSPKTPQYPATIGKSPSAVPPNVSQA